MPFSKLGLSPQVLKGVSASGYAQPTAIQLRAIPLIMAGRDVIGSAQTGTGKTAANGIDGAWGQIFTLDIVAQRD